MAAVGRVRPEGTLKPIGPDRWMVRVSYGVDATGRRVRRQWVVRGKKHDAQRELRAELDKRVRTSEGAVERLVKVTLREWIDEWLGTWCNDMSDRTRDGYRGNLERYLDPALAARRLTAITPTHVQHWINALTKRGLGPRTVRMAHGALRTCLYRAVKLGKLTRNVATLVDLPKMRHREMQYLTPDQVHRFLLASQGDRWHALFTVMVLTGVRPSEALALRWRDLDGDCLHVQRALTTGGRFASTKTGRKRKVALDTRTKAVLEEHRAWQDTWRAQLGTSYEDQDLIFPNDLGRPADAHNIVNRHFKPLLRTAGLPSVRFYDLRHTAATLCFAAGDDMKTVQDRLGHASITLTMNTYTHVADDIRRRTARRLDELLDTVQSAHHQRAEVHGL